MRWRRAHPATGTTVLLMALGPAIGTAQVRAPAFTLTTPATVDPQAQTPEEEDDAWTFLGTAKWASLAIAGGSAVYGFSLNSQADEVFDLLDQICLDEPDRCDNRNPDGSFTDPDLEDRYQSTLEKDRQARTALLISQVFLAGAVVFFIMDLSNRSPPNVPYDPPVTLEVGPTPQGAFSLGARVRLGR
jgi:hypothetical protein